MNNDLKDIKKIHFVGIKGVGMTPLACIAKDFGMEVSGSDVEEKFVTDQVLEKKKITCEIGFRPTVVEEGRPDLVVYGAAHQGENNPEVKKAKKLGIAVLTQGEVLGLFFNRQLGISICGVGGKTTTAAMLATILEKADFHPSYMVGAGSVSSLAFPGKYDKRGKIFITEADEYACSVKDKTPKFCYQKPKMIILTNLAFDHPDVYHDEEETLRVFKNFIQTLPKDGKLIANGDSSLIRQLIKKVTVPVLTYGTKPEVDYLLTNYQIKDGKGYFSLKGLNQEFCLRVPGLHNGLNAAGAIIAAKLVGVEEKAISQGLDQFLGTKRRFEKIGQIKSTLLYDDYAHHPLQLRATLKAAKQWLPNKKIIAIFQPHTYSRTKALLKEFAKSFDQADQVIITDIFASAREKDNLGITSQDLVEVIKVNQKNVIYCPNKKATIEYLKKQDLENTAIFTLGAGDIFLWHREIIKLF